MQVSSTQTAQGAAYAQQNAKKTFTPISPFTSTQTDTVTLSAQARQMYAPGSKVMMVGDHPVIVAPDDKGTYPSQEKLEEDWNRLARIPQSAQDLIPHASFVIEEGLTIDAEREAAYEALSPQQRQDREEYMQKLIVAFREEYESRGMTFMDYEEQTKTDFALRDEIDQSLRERLWADPRAVELMKEFDIATGPSQLLANR